MRVHRSTTDSDLHKRRSSQKSSQIHHRFGSSQKEVKSEEFTDPPQIRIFTKGGQVRRVHRSTTDSDLHKRRSSQKSSQIHHRFGSSQKEVKSEEFTDPPQVQIFPKK